MYGWLVTHIRVYLFARLDNPCCRHLLRHICLWFILQLYWANRSCSFWERAHDLAWWTVWKRLACLNSVMMTYDFVLPQPSMASKLFRLSNFIHTAWGNPWYCFQAHLNSTRAWDCLHKLILSRIHFPYKVTIVRCESGSQGQNVNILTIWSHVQ